MLQPIASWGDRSPHMRIRRFSDCSVNEGWALHVKTIFLQHPISVIDWWMRTQPVMRFAPSRLCVNFLPYAPPAHVRTYARTRRTAAFAAFRCTRPGVVTANIHEHSRPGHPGNGRAPMSRRRRPSRVRARVEGTTLATSSHRIPRAYARARA